MMNGYAVSAAHPIAVDIGMNILQRGGNAVDAAIAISFALGVVEPHASGIGGGGNMLIYPNNDTPPVLYDYREIAPTYVSSEYNVGVPGFLKGMEEISRDYGHFSLNTLIDPAIDVAENGFHINDVLARQMSTTKHKRLMKMKNFFPKNKPLAENELLVQQELAESMRMIATRGADFMYRGPLGKEIVKRGVGITEADLADYEIKIRRPLQSNYGPYNIWTAPAPAGGGVLIQALHLLESLGLDDIDVSSPAFIVGLAKILRKGYEQRIQTNGDPDFISINEEPFIQASHFHHLAAAIRNENYFLEDLSVKEYNNTTHFAVIDAQGMMVSTTNTLSNLFGAGIQVNGIFLNDQMRNFTNRESSPNKIETGKRCQSLIAPTIISKNDQPFITIGSSGGQRITTMIVRTLIQYLKQNIPLQDAVAKERFYVNKKEVFSEKAMNKSDQETLAELGYKYTHFPTAMFYGGVHALVRHEDTIEGAADPRRGGIWRKGLYDELLM